MAATVNKPRIITVVNGTEYPIPIKGNSALARLLRAGVATEEWAMPSATTAEVYTVQRCTRTGRILYSSCPCWKFNPRRGFEDCAHTAPVAEAAKLRELIALYGGPEWTLAALQVEDALLRGLLAEGENGVIRQQYTAVGEAIARRLPVEQVAA
ncbi:MAG TPA: hypothetical protein VIL85_08945 [Thermomicrobiales bacterium]|jgi:hypothetical protein